VHSARPRNFFSSGNRAKVIIRPIFLRRPNGNLTSYGFYIKKIISGPRAYEERRLAKNGFPSKNGYVTLLRKVLKHQDREQKNSIILPGGRIFRKRCQNGSLPAGHEY
jgi:hypothetical protein